jgi:hypothetical protein
MVGAMNSMTGTYTFENDITSEFLAKFTYPPGSMTGTITGATLDGTAILT